MSAGEKLKALAPGPNDWFVPHGWPDPDLSVEQGSAAWAALVAVVEAAENAGPEPALIRPLRAALTALEESLS